MAVSIEWHPRAIADLREIAAFIARGSESRATQAVERIVGVVDRLSTFPRSGRIVPEFDDPSIRQRTWKDYRIIYSIEPGPRESVIVLAVVHGFRRLEDALGLDLE